MTVYSDIRCENVNEGTYYTIVPTFLNHLQIRLEQV